MKGILVSLVPVEDDDFPLIADWCRPGRVGSLATGGEADFVSAADVRQGNRHSAGNGQAIVRVNSDGRRIGLVSWHRRKHDRSYEIGGVVGDVDLWDGGYGLDASELLLDYLFHVRNAHRVQFITGLYNKRVIGFFFKKHVTVEGILRDYFFLDGAYHDAIVGSMLRDEYYRAVADPANPDDRYAIIDDVPETDKRAAREAFRDHMRAHWDDMFKQLVERD